MTIEPNELIIENKGIKGVRPMLMIIAAATAFAALYLGKGLALPIVIAFIIALTLSPVVQSLKKLRIPRHISAAILLASLAVAIVSGIYAFATPVANALSDAPQIGWELRAKLKGITGSIDSINKAGEQVEKVTQGTPSYGVQEVVVKQPGLISRAADDLLAFAAISVVTLTLSFFLLTSRDLFATKLIQLMPTLTDKKKALGILIDAEDEISRYLLTVALINTFLGIAVGLVFALLGMSNAVMWGTVAAILNFLPYVGAIVGVGASAVYGILEFPTLWEGLVPALCYLLINITEGQFVTPAFLGKRFSINTVVILVSIVFWGFLWGAAGVFVAVPILLIIKILCERIEGWQAVGLFLSATDAPLPDDNTT